MLGMKSKTKTKSGSDRNHSSNGLPSKMGKGATTVIAKGTKLDGIFECSQDVRLDGEILGEVKCDGRLVMGESGKISGKIKTSDADIMGTIEGEIVVNGSLVLRSTAFIKGTIIAAFMSVEEGARYTGECKVGENRKKKKETPVLV